MSVAVVATMEMDVELTIFGGIDQVIGFGDGAVMSGGAGVI
jgi:hypothetical protein